MYNVLCTINMEVVIISNISSNCKYEYYQAVALTVSIQQMQLLVVANICNYVLVVPADAITSITS